LISDKKTAMQSAALLVILGAMLSGCAWIKGKSASASAQDSPTTWSPGAGGSNSKQAVVTAGRGAVGRVKSVNASARFVVISSTVGTLPSLHQRLNAYRNGLKVAELKVTGPTRDTHTVADILAGECQVGDEVTEE
jgi:hypothetical protein